MFQKQTSILKIEFVAVTELVYFFLSAGVFLVGSITESFIPVQKVYRRNRQHFLFLLLYISLCRIKSLPSQGPAVQQKEQALIPTHDFLIVINIWMILLTQSEANLLYPSTKIGNWELTSLKD